MGGAENYDAKLDQHFSGGHNVHSNEPSHHYGYLYDFGGQPWKTQAKVREIAAKEYDASPGGLDGDDDCGQMSAWLLFTAMGFYPVNPASGEYMIGSPMYRADVARTGKRKDVPGGGEQQLEGQRLHSVGDVERKDTECSAHHVGADPGWRRPAFCHGSEAVKVGQHLETHEDSQQLAF